MFEGGNREKRKEQNDDWVVSEDRGKQKTKQLGERGRRVVPVEQNHQSEAHKDNLFHASIKDTEDTDPYR